MPFAPLKCHRSGKNPYRIPLLFGGHAQVQPKPRHAFPNPDIEVSYSWPFLDERKQRSEKLNGDSTASTVTTEVVQYRRGFWRVKVHLLTKTGWKLIAWDLWDEDDRADFWKKRCSK
jgi:hypothetical protein